MNGPSSAAVCAALTLSPEQGLSARLPFTRGRYREMADSLIPHPLIELDVGTVKLGDLSNSPSLIGRIIDRTLTSMTSVGAVAHNSLGRYFARVSTLTRRARFTLLLSERLVSSTRRTSDDSMSGSDVGIQEGAPMLSVVRSVDARSEKVQRPMSNHLKMIGLGSSCLYGVSWSSDVWARWAARRQESTPRTPVDDDYSPDRDNTILPTRGRLATNWRCD